MHDDETEGGPEYSGLEATYSPQDNKLRLYAATRLPAEVYARVKAAGFQWAPKQDLFYAPAWTPEREDFLLELCGEIGDESTSREDRAAERAERFEVYQAKRAADADRAHAAVDAIAQRFEGGQPILVGHHSEKRARKDAERIENGMRKAVNLWRTSEYWKGRAAGSLRDAAYKERPGVRARRIKGLEADERKQRRERERAQLSRKLWATMHDDAKHQKRDGSGPGTFAERARWYAGNTNTTGWGTYSALCDGKITPEEAQRQAIETADRIEASADRWLEHLGHRLEYERAMLEADGATALLAPKARPKLLPLCNYRAPGGVTGVRSRYRGGVETREQVEMTAAEYARINGDYKATCDVGNSHRVRSAVVRGSLVCVFLTDSKVHERPADVDPKPRALPPVPEPRAPEPVNPQEEKFQAIAESLRAGVKVVSAPQLFPTPPELAERMAARAELWPGARVLEPSAGTGRLIRAIYAEAAAEVVAVEVNPELAEMLRKGDGRIDVREADFLACNGDLGTFDRVVMNPPFTGGSDIRHVLHARKFLRPGGLLVALCAAGPRQEAALQPLADSWEVLPEGSFKAEGAGVRVALLTMGPEE